MAPACDADGHLRTEAADVLVSNAIPLPDGSLTDWQEVTVSYTNADPLAKRVLVRCSAQRNRGEIYEVWTTSLE
jgi:hypothetical protein